jgi:hypothetical protein
MVSSVLFSQRRASGSARDATYGRAGSPLWKVFQVVQILVPTGRELVLSQAAQGDHVDLLSVRNDHLARSEAVRKRAPINLNFKNSLKSTGSTCPAKGHLPIDLYSPQPPRRCLGAPVPVIALAVQILHDQGVSINSHRITDTIRRAKTQRRTSTVSCRLRFSANVSGEPRRASRDIMHLLVRRLSVLPVVGIAVQMHDSHDNDVVGSVPEENAKRECLRETAAYVKFNDRLKAGTNTDAVGGVLI